MKKTIALLLSALLLLGLAACSKDADAPNAPEATEYAPASPLVGEWSAPVDCTEEMIEFVTEGDKNMRQYFPIEKFELQLMAQFFSDGTYLLFVDQNALQNSMAELDTLLYDGVVAYTADQGLSREQIESLNITPDELLKVFHDKGFEQQLLESTNINGAYIYEDDMLYLSEEYTRKPDKTHSIKVGFEGARLTFSNAQTSFAQQTELNKLLARNPVFLRTENTDVR